MLQLMEVPADLYSGRKTVIIVVVSVDESHYFQFDTSQS